MRVNDPEVTLEVEAHGFPEESRDTAQLDWALVASVIGDDGKHYWFNIGAMSLREAWGNFDFWAMSGEIRKRTSRFATEIGVQDR